MTRFVAFLRGVNVGGHVVKKEKLKETFISLGFQDVSTLKHSGNVIFESNIDNIEEICRKIEEKLCSIFGFEVLVFIRTFTQLKCIIELNPFKEYNSKDQSFLVTLLSSRFSKFPLPLPTAIANSSAQVIAAEGMEVFSVTHGGGEGALPNPFVEKTLKTKATTRNLNIIKEILKKYG